MNVGKNVKEERLRCEITQRELAEKSGLSISYICDIEVGRTNPSLKTLEKLGGALEIAIDKLLRQN